MFSRENADVNLPKLLSRVLTNLGLPRLAIRRMVILLLGPPYSSSTLKNLVRPCSRHGPCIHVLLIMTPPVLVKQGLNNLKHATLCRPLISLCRPLLVPVVRCLIGANTIVLRRCVMGKVLVPLEVLVFFLSFVTVMVLLVIGVLVLFPLLEPLVICLC